MRSHVASWRFALKFSSMNLPAAAGLSEVTKANLCGAFFQSRNSGESVPCRYKWSKRTDSILAEYYLRIQYIRPLGPGNTPGLHLTTSVDLHFHLFPHPMYHQQSRGIAGILFRMASRHTATISTSCSIWPHEILAFTTSAFPSFYSSYILAHFQVFTVQSHATQLTALRRRSYVSVNNTSGELFSLPVIFVFEEVGGGSDVFV